MSIFFGLILANCHTSIFLIKNLSGSTEVFQRRPWRRQTLKALPPRGGGHQLAVSPAHFFIRPKLFCSRCHTFLSDQNFLLWLSHFLFSAHFFIRPKLFVHIVTLFILRTLFILSCLSRTLFYPTKTFFAPLSPFFILHTFYAQLSLPHTFLSAHFLFSAHFLSLAVSPAQFSIRPKLFLLSLSHFFVRQNFFCSCRHTFYSPHTFYPLQNFVTAKIVRIDSCRLKLNRFVHF